MNAALLRRPTPFILCAASVMLAGCGPDLPRVVDVTGTVIYKDQPLEGAEVTFLRQGEKPARGTTDANGRFHLKTYVNSQYDLDGAIPREYVVRVAKLESLVRPEDKSLGDVIARHPDGPQQLVPPRYADAETTELRASVTEGGPNVFEFILID